MSRSELIRWGGLTAMLGGILRGIASFMPTTPGLALQVLYFAIDVLFLVGITDLYAFQRKQTGRWGVVGFLIAFIGVALLIGNDVVKAPTILYPVAASLFTVGTGILALSWWATKTFPRWIAVALILPIFVGLPGYVFKELSVLFLIAGVIFSIGFIGAGLTVWLSRSRSSVRSPSSAS